MRPISFQIEKEFPGTLARAGILKTPHGDIQTPAFISVATKATIKGVSSEQFSDLGVQGIIANTYHLYLVPGEKIVEKAGGVGKFMHFDGPVMTDSGGFQVFSLGAGFGKKLSKFLPEQESAEDAVSIWSEEVASQHGKLAIVDEEGVSFTSHLDGSLHRFTPERSIEIQHALGADIIYAFDECTAPTADHAYQKEAMDRTHEWAKRSLAAHRRNIEKNNSQGIYGIVQGGRFEDLRIKSAREIASMDFDGFGIGGSFSKFDILGILDKVNRELPKEKPRHLLGIGEPEDIFIGVEAGIDTFDCVLPTRNGRTGGIYTEQGKIQLPNAEYKEDLQPLDPQCTCHVCKNFSRAYISHLFRAKEMLGPILASEHNIYFLANLTKRIRNSLLEGTFLQFRDTFLHSYKV
ncbi:tRNA guanosine(34) transglycosylase Tgt [Acetobacteraceae bacterium]|nr:tRNA guanosine(34) transglycosylase Tgt [Candidatus Parcubacteria bacterium]